MNNPESLHTEFDWAVYADATFAGLSILIPIPIVDWFFEQLFRRRMPNAIAKRRRQPLTPEIVDIINRLSSNRLRTCLLLPLVLVFWLLKRISRKILYFLTIKEASDMVSHYWHRAFLLDTMLLHGHLDHPDTADIARKTMEGVLDSVTTSPLLQLAQQITKGTHHILRSLFKARKGNEDAMLKEKKAQMNQSWASFDTYFQALAAQYLQAYQERLEAKS